MQATEPHLTILIQHGLMALGFDLPLFGADGDWGKETQQAYEEYQATIDEDLHGERIEKMDITLLQHGLLNRGFALPRFGADGDWGNETQQAYDAYIESLNPAPEPITDDFDDTSPLTASALRSELAIEEDFIPAGSSNRSGRLINASHITIHNTANKSSGAGAKTHARYIKGAHARQRKVCWHYTIDDRDCVQHIPTNERGLHAGTTQGNNQSIGIEVCENSDAHFDRTIDRATRLTALLLHELDIPMERLVTHRDWSGKDCPKAIFHEWEGGFERFKQKVAHYLARLND